MLELSCHCGNVRIEVEKRPAFVNECNCTLCSKTGACWGYYHPSQVRVSGPADGYVRKDKQDPAVEIQFCGQCGTTTHFMLTESAAAKFGNEMMGVNMRLAAEADLAGTEWRYPDGLAWSGSGD